MPLVELGLVSRFEADDPALQQRPAPASRRTLRCVAGFYALPAEAQVVAASLRRQFGLDDHQVEVIPPDGLTRQAFSRVAQRWQCLRPRWGLLGQGLHLVIGAATGMLTGGAASLLGWVLLAGADTGAGLLPWLVPGLWAGAVAGAVSALVMCWRQARHRFDDTVARKLRRGYSAVVAHGLATRHEAAVLAYLQDTSHSWCAEAPRRDVRL